MMEVKLAKITPGAVEEIYKAYKICYAKAKQSDIKIPMVETSMGDFPDIQRMTNFITPLMDDGHTSPLEHCSMTFYINGVSRALMAQITRHRTAKFNIQSQRYVDAKNFDYVTPPTIIDAGLEGIYNQMMQESFNNYDLLVTELVTFGIEQKMAQEDARFALTNATTCNITMTIDLHNFRNFYGLRACKNAQWEIRALAEEMMRQVLLEVPFARYGAKRCGKLCRECI